MLTRQIFYSKIRFARHKFVCERFASLVKNCLQTGRISMSSGTCERVSVSSTIDLQRLFLFLTVITSNMLSWGHRKTPHLRYRALNPFPWFILMKNLTKNEKSFWGILGEMEEVDFELLVTEN
jgi:hypothetical protein